MKLDPLTSLFNIPHSYSLQIELLVIVCATFFIQFLQKRYLQSALEKLKGQKFFWNGAVIRSIQRPLNYLVYLLGLTYSVDFIKVHFVLDKWITWTEELRAIGLLTLIVWCLLLLSKEWETYHIRVKKGRKLDKTTASGFGRLIRIAISTIAAITVMQSLGYKLSGLLALGGAGTIVAGLAAQDMLSNLFGGLMIYFDRPFSEGDWINSPDRNLEGTVQHIGWRMTRIVSFDKRPIYVPNSVFSKIILVNPSRMTNRRIKEIVGLRYDDASKVPVILSEITNMIKTHPDIDTDATIFVNVVKFAPSALDCQIYCFTKTTDWIKYQAIQQDVFMKIIEIIASHQAEVAFPTSTVHVPNTVTVDSQSSE